MSPVEIKIQLLRNGLTISGLARDFTIRLGRLIRREELSMCIRQVREYPELRQLLAEELNTTVEQLFGAQRQKAA